MPLFEVAILKVPTEKEEEDGKKEELVFNPKFVVAATGQSAAQNIFIKEAASLADYDVDTLEVLVRPFA